MQWTRKTGASLVIAALLALDPISAACSTTQTFESTAYCLTGTTKTGTPAGPGLVAVDPTVIPYGTRMYIEGYGPAIAADCGPAIKGKMIDVWFPTAEECKQWGRRKVQVTIYAADERSPYDSQFAIPVPSRGIKSPVKNGKRVPDRRTGNGKVRNNPRRS